MGRRRRQRPPSEPHWAPLPRPQFSLLQRSAIVLRHFVPLACLFWFGGSVLQFLLLNIFDLALGIAGIVSVGVGVSTRQERAAASGADAIAGFAMLAFVCAGISLVLSFLFGWIFAVMVAHEGKGLWDPVLWWSALLIVACALPGMAMQYLEDLKSGLSEEQRKRRDQPVIGVHLFSAVFIVLLGMWTLGWGRVGAILMALAVTALFIFRDLRPDLARALTRPGKAKAH